MFFSKYKKDVIDKSNALVGRDNPIFDNPFFTTVIILNFIFEYFKAILIFYLNNSKILPISVGINFEEVNISLYF